MKNKSIIIAKATKFHSVVPLWNRRILKIAAVLSISLLQSFFSNVVYSQDRAPYDFVKGKTAYRANWLVGLSTDSAHILSADIAKIAKSKYSFAKESETDSILKIVYAKGSIEDSTTNLTVIFQKGLGNQKNGSQITKITCYYLILIKATPAEDIFPFWRKYIDPDSKITNLRKKCEVGPSPSRIVSFSNEPDTIYKCYFSIQGDYSFAIKAYKTDDYGFSDYYNIEK